ncbi:hypothetical protein BC826DRAFT_1073102, partial [Russula brevipes]
MRLPPSEEVPLPVAMTPYGRDVFYTLGSPVGYSDYLLAEMSIFIAAYLVRYRILLCTVPASFY